MVTCAVGCLHVVWWSEVTVDSNEQESAWYAFEYNFRLRNVLQCFYVYMYMYGCMYASDEMTSSLIMMRLTARLSVVIP